MEKQRNSVWTPVQIRALVTGIQKWVPFLVGEKMNLNSIMRKLQRAIIQKGLIIKIGSTQFYSAEQKRMITIYILSTRVLQKNQRDEWKEKDYEILRSASQIEIVNCLNDIWQAVRE